jgi:hypothetical protein
MRAAEIAAFWSKGLQFPSVSSPASQQSDSGFSKNSWFDHSAATGQTIASARSAQPPQSARSVWNRPPRAVTVATQSNPGTARRPQPKQQPELVLTAHRKASTNRSRAIASGAVVNSSSNVQTDVSLGIEPFHHQQLLDAQYVERHFLGATMQLPTTNGELREMLNSAPAGATDLSTPFSRPSAHASLFDIDAEKLSRNPKFYQTDVAGLRRTIELQKLDGLRYAMDMGIKQQQQQQQQQHAHPRSGEDGDSSSRSSSRPHTTPATLDPAARSARFAAALSSARGHQQEKIIEARVSSARREDALPMEDTELYGEDPNDLFAAAEEAAKHKKSRTQDDRMVLRLDNDGAIAEETVEEEEEKESGSSSSSPRRVTMENISRVLAASEEAERHRRAAAAEQAAKEEAKRRKERLLNKQEEARLRRIEEERRKRIKEREEIMAATAEEEGRPTTATAATIDEEKQQQQQQAASPASSSPLAVSASSSLRASPALSSRSVASSSPLLDSGKAPATLAPLHATISAPLASSSRSALEFATTHHVSDQPLSAFVAAGLGPNSSASSGPEPIVPAQMPAYSPAAFEALWGTLQSLGREMHNFKTVHLAVEKDLLWTRGELHHTLSLHANCDTMKLSFESQVRALNTEIRRLKNACEKGMRERIEVDSARAKLQQELQALLVSSSAEVQTLRQQLAATAEQRTICARENETLHAAIHAASHESSKSSAKEVELHHELLHTKTALESMRNKSILEAGVAARERDERAKEQARFRGERAALAAEADKLNKLIDELRSRLGKQERDIENQKDVASTATRQLGDAQAENANLKRQLEATGAIVTSVTAKHNTLEADFSRAKAALATLQNSNLDSKGKLAELEAELALAREARDAAVAAKAAAENTLADSKSAVRSAAEDSEAQICSLQLALQDAKKLHRLEVELKGKEILGLQELLEERKSAISSLKAELDELSFSLSNKARENSGLRDELGSVHAALASSKEALSDALAKLKHAKLKHAQNKAELVKLNAIKTAAINAENARIVAETAREQATNERQRAVDELTATKEQLVAAEDRMRRAEEEGAEVRLERDARAQELYEARRELDSTSQRETAIRRDFAALSSTHSHCGGEIARATEETARTHTAFREVQEQLRTMHRNSEKTRSENQQIRQEFATLKQELEIVKKELEQRSTERDEARQDAEKFRLSIATAAAASTEPSTAPAAVTEDDTKEPQPSSSENLAAQSAEIEKLRAELETQRGESEKIRTELESERATSAAAASETQEKLTTELEELHAQLRRTEEDLAAARAEVLAQVQVRSATGSSSPNLQPSPRAGTFNRSPSARSSGADSAAPAPPVLTRPLSSPMSGRRKPLRSSRDGSQIGTPRTAASPPRIPASPVLKPANALEQPLQTDGRE